MKLTEHIRTLILAGFSLLVGVGMILIGGNQLTSSMWKERELKLQKVQQGVSSDLANNIDVFVAIGSGMRQYIHQSIEFPTTYQLQGYLRGMLQDLSIEDSIVVSFVDTSHTFKMSFTPYQVDPAGLVGRSVSAIRDDDELARLRNLMGHNGIEVFDPLNLVEGWVGIPVNFRVYRDSVTSGYFASLINFETIKERVEENPLYDDFQIRYFNARGQEFDGLAVYDGSEIYNLDYDPSVARDTTIKGMRMQASYQLYNLPLTILVGYKEPFSELTLIRLAILLTLIAFTVVVFIVTYQIIWLRHQKRLLRVKNQILVKQSTLIESRNSQLMEMNATKNRFFSVIGHDVKGPLININGLLDIIKDATFEDPEVKMVFGKLRKSAKSTLELLNQLLDWSISTSGKERYNPSRLLLSQILHDVVDNAEPAADRKSIKLKLHIAQDVTYSGDKNMLASVFRNLVFNAIKYTQPHGKVDVSLTADEQKITIAVQDNGVGMSEDKLATLYNLHDLVLKRESSEEVGTGLGLILCKEYIDLHKGEMVFESAPGKGTTIRVLLIRNIG